MKLNSKTMEMQHLGPRLLVILFMAASALHVQSAVAKTSAGTDTAKTSATAVKRDPFWPVGYTPEWSMNAGQAPREVGSGGNVDGDWNTAMKQVAIQGVSSSADNDSYAVINGEIKTVGDTVSVKQGSSTYTWAVESITPPSSVKLRRASVK